MLLSALRRKRIIFESLSYDQIFSRSTQAENFTLSSILINKKVLSNIQEIGRHFYVLSGEEKKIKIYV